MSNLEKLQKILEAFDNDSLTKEDILKAFEKVVNIVIELKKQNTEEIAQLRSAFEQITKKIGSDTNLTLEDLKKKTNDLFVGERMNDLASQVAQKLKDVDERMATVKSGIDGKNGKDGRNGRDGVSIRGEDGLGFSQEMLDKVEELLNKPQQLGRAFGPSVITPRPLSNITPVGTINGVNKDFRLPKDPKKDGERVYLNGVRMRSGSANDYTLAGRVISFNDAPLTGDIIICDIDF